MNTANTSEIDRISSETSSGRLYIIRHGQSTQNRDGIGGGHGDYPLTELGVQQALTTKAKLSHVTFDAAWSSDLPRARQTAEIVFGGPVPQAHQLPELRERYYGHYEGGPNKVIKVLQAEQAEAIAAMDDEARWLHRIAPDVESEYELVDRFVGALGKIALRHPNQTVLVGAHGGPIRLTLVKLGYATFDDVPSGSFQNGGYIALDYRRDQLSVAEVSGVTLHNENVE